MVLGAWRLILAVFWGRAQSGVVCAQVACICPLVGIFAPVSAQIFFRLEQVFYGCQLFGDEGT